MCSVCFTYWSNFYPRPPRGGRRPPPALEDVEQAISIHALREEGDVGQHTEGGGRFLFLSTPSARRATTPSKEDLVEAGNFYPRPPRGGRHSPCVAWEQGHSISIHALREEGDPAAIAARRPLSNDFYPRPPRGGRLMRRFSCNMA